MTVTHSATAVLSRYLPAIEAAIDQVLPAAGELTVMLRYHFGWCDATGQPSRARSGKRVRPVLVLLAAEAAGGSGEGALPAAVAVELLHNFSLIHDDIQDRSQERRGRPTVWAIWGEAQAINAGNALHVLAYRALARLAVPPERWAAAFDRFTATALRLCQGQYLDLAYEQRATISRDDYLTMIAGENGRPDRPCPRAGSDQRERRSRPLGAVSPDR
ncbi:MAG: hypothetical protein KatS3mg061_0932 [Dehalococcoidia bacterium]|nr:MAG: hypothetical protein KatS3mg061_0932 [Dehalococcoidia bacterium]